MNVIDATRLEHVLQSRDLHAAKPRKIKHEDSEQVDLSGAQALNQSLQNQPELRASRLERIRNILATTHYPPEELIRGISKLIAEHQQKSEAA